ncbi:putative holin-like toxin [Paenibacillus sp. 598K]|nr:putative holin-like toxin [Paenibacillus sp. 598K]
MAALSFFYCKHITRELDVQRTNSHVPVTITEKPDAITLMIAFGVLIISLIGLVVNIVDAMTKKK